MHFSFLSKSLSSSSLKYLSVIFVFFFLPILFAFAQSAPPSPPPSAPESPATPEVDHSIAAPPLQQNATIPASSPATQLANKDAEVVVLGYHKFEDRPRDMLAIAPQAFREQMQTLKNAGIPVISLKDFLAWKKGEKAIPPKSVLITIDDGFISGYSVAWPILKEFGYPFVMYVYTKYVDVGGKSITWDQLREMRDAGVEFGSHSVSHDNMVRPKKLKGGDYQEWLHNELFGSKRTLESQLNLPITTFAFPYGIHNPQIVKEALKGGYTVLFAVKPAALIRFSSPPGSLGRFMISSTQPNTFKQAIHLIQSGGAPIPEAKEAAAQAKKLTGTLNTATATAAPSVAATLITEPKNGEIIHNPLPEIKADLTGFGNIEPHSVHLAISSFGPVAATYDPSTKMLSYKVTRPIREKTVTVFLSLKNEKGSTKTTWTFHYGDQATPGAAAGPVD